jgi:hypothetical protein
MNKLRRFSTTNKWFSGIDHKCNLPLWFKSYISHFVTGNVSRTVFRAFSKTDFWLYKVSKKTLWKFNRLSCIIDFAKQFNFYIHYNLFISIKIKSVVGRLFFS